MFKKKVLKDDFDQLVDSVNKLHKTLEKTKKKQVCEYELTILYDGKCMKNDVICDSYDTGLFNSGLFFYLDGIVVFECLGYDFYKLVKK